LHTLQCRLLHAIAAWSKVIVSLNTCRSVFAALRGRVTLQSETVAELEAELAKREEKVFRDFSRRVGVSNIREFENERLKLAEQYAAEKAAIVSQLHNLQQQIAYEEQRDLNAAITAAQTKIAEIDAQEKAKQKEMEKAEAEAEKEQAKTADALKEAEKINKQMEGKQADLKHIKKQGS